MTKLDVVLTENREKNQQEQVQESRNQRNSIKNHDGRKKTSKNPE